MPSRNRASFVLLMLLALTAASYWLAHWEVGDKNAMLSGVIMIITFLKARLIIVHFMGTGGAPLPLRIAGELWPAIMVLVLLLIGYA